MYVLVFQKSCAFDGKSTDAAAIHSGTFIAAERIGQKKAGQNEN